MRNFDRFEFKYVVPVCKGLKFLDDCIPYVELDSHAAESGGYCVQSLYYDSDTLACYWEKMESLKFRRKVRVRSYGKDDDDVFVEIKQRIDRTVQKRRWKIARSRADQLLSGEGDAGEDVAGLGEVAYLKHRYQLKPKIVVSYDRIPYVGRFDEDLRVTLDTNLRGHNGTLSDFGSREHGRHFLSNDQAVLEVKFNRMLPVWMSKQLARYNLMTERMSKYCHAVSLFWNPYVESQIVAPLLINN